MEWSNKNFLVRTTINENPKLAPTATFYGGHFTGSPAVALSEKRAYRFSKGTRFADVFYAITASFSGNNRSSLCQPRHCTSVPLHPLHRLVAATGIAPTPSHRDNVLNIVMPLSPVSSETWTVGNSLRSLFAHEIRLMTVSLPRMLCQPLMTHSQQVQHQPRGRCDQVRQAGSPIQRDR